VGLLLGLLELRVPQRLQVPIHPFFFDAYPYSSEKE
jgi:hypothetical protein